jgi:hypothetical protein
VIYKYFDGNRDWQILNTQHLFVSQLYTSAKLNAHPPLFVSMLRTGAMCNQFILWRLIFLVLVAVDFF